MRWTTGILAGALLLSLAVPGCSSTEAPGGHSVEEQIQALLDLQAQAWTVGDLEAFCSVYADDTVFVSPSGLTKGRQEVLERYRRRYPDKSSMGTLTLEVLEVRVAGQDLKALSASLVGRWTLSYPDRDAATGLTLLVLHRDEDGPWRIVQDASM